MPSWVDGDVVEDGEGTLGVLGVVIDDGRAVQWLETEAHCDMLVGDRTEYGCPVLRLHRFDDPADRALALWLAAETQRVHLDSESAHKDF